MIKIHVYSVYYDINECKTHHNYIQFIYSVSIWCGNWYVFFDMKFHLCDISSLSHPIKVDVYICLYYVTISESLLIHSDSIIMMYFDIPHFSSFLIHPIMSTQLTWNSQCICACDCIYMCIPFTQELALVMFVSLSSSLEWHVILRWSFSWNSQWTCHSNPIKWRCVISLLCYSIAKCAINYIYRVDFTELDRKLVLMKCRNLMNIHQ